MKLLMVTPFYYPIIGGTETFIENISLKLNELGVQTDIMTFNFDEKVASQWKRKFERINGLNVIKIPGLRAKPLDVFQITHLPGLFMHEFKNYDIIHFHNDVNLSFPVLSYFVNKPKIFHCHCLDTTYYDCYRWNFVAKRLLSHVADIYVALSNSLREMLVNLGIPSYKIRVIHNGVDINKFQPKENAKTRNTLLFVGRLSAKKGLPILLKALEHLTTRVKLEIVGPISIDPEYSYAILDLGKKINEKGFHSVEYLGILSLDELIQRYQKASIFVLPSFSESFPIVNLEALACGTPVVATDVGAISEVVKNHENGILIAPNKPTELAEAIQYLLDNDEIRRKYGLQGRKTISQNFSIDAVAKKLLKIYRQMLVTHINN